MTRSKWIKVAVVCLSLFIFFFILHFPLNRLGPKIAREIETALQLGLGVQASCRLEGFGLAFPLGVSSDRFECKTRRDQLFQFDSLTARLGLGNLSLRVKSGSGEMSLQSPLSSSPDHLSFKFQNFPIERLMPLIDEVARAANPAHLQIKVAGNLTGSAELPLTQLHQAEALIDLKFENLLLPEQSVLTFIGINQLKFNKSELKATLTDGNLQIDSAEFLANEIAAKVSGQMKLAEQLADSTGMIEFKWKIARTPAIENSLWGPSLLNSPCPGQDEEGFCTQRITKLGDMQNLFSVRF